MESHRDAARYHGRLSPTGSSSKGKLVAVIVRLCEQHEGSEGMWNLEAGFGRLTGSVPPPFIDVDAAQDWVAKHMEK